MIAIKFLTYSCKQGEQLPDWEIYMQDANGDDITSYDVNIRFYAGNNPTPALSLFPGTGMVKTGARSVVDKFLPIDFVARTYNVECRVILGDGKIYKSAPFVFSVTKSLDNG